MGDLVLVVEDDDSLRVIYRHLLTKMGCDIVEAITGTQAIDILEQSTPKVILLDMMLPQENGDVVLEYVQQIDRLHDTRILIITSNKSYQHYADELPQVDFALKPVLPVQIREYISSIAV
jgi:CheY-like chemotaxis protein